MDRITVSEAIHRHQATPWSTQQPSPKLPLERHTPYVVLVCTAAINRFRCDMSFGSLRWMDTEQRPNHVPNVPPR